MNNLELYANKFDDFYKRYADCRYKEIKSLIEIYNQPDICEFIEKKEFSNFYSLIQPVIAIKNYKSQVPFPEDLKAVIQCIKAVKSQDPDQNYALKNHYEVFQRLLSIQGFQLPTVSAIMHFCHPDAFPIVDINVQNACRIIKKNNRSHFDGIILPSLPAPNTSSNNKSNKYIQFISFINKVRELQSENTKSQNLPSFRFIDKALMVLGNPKLQQQFENNSYN